MAKNPGSSPFSSSPFRWLYVATAISATGSQFTTVALPWLVLLLTGSAAQLGVAMAIIALPRAFFILLGGAIADRRSPLKVLLISRFINAVLLGLLAALTLTGTIRIEMVYMLAAGIGISNAFAAPTGGAIMQQVCTPEQLHSGNANIMGLRQLSGLIGPLLAGGVIAATTGTTTTHSTYGVGIAFAIDAVSFLFAVGCIFMVRIERDREPSAPTAGILASLLKSFRELWQDTEMRALIGYMAILSLFVGGPLEIALPLLAKNRLSEGAAALGILMTANGTGMLLGNIASRPIARLMKGRLGLMLLIVDAMVGLMVVSLSVVHSTVVGAGITGGIGLLEGTVMIGVVTWLQLRVPKERIGQTMSLVMFTSLLLAPLSAVLAGILLGWLPLASLLVISGFSLSIIALMGLTRPILTAIRLPVPESASR